MSAKLKIGEPAPPFVAQDSDGNEWRLEGLAGKKVILFFYPADFTPG